MKQPLCKSGFVVTAALAAILLFTGNAARARQASAKLPPPPDPEIGSSAPDFELKVLGSKGKTMKLSDLKGKAVLVDFWATYCEPCKTEMPWFAELQKKYGPEGFQVVGISMDDEAEEKAISDFAKKLGVNYPILLGTDRVANLYGGIEGLPMSFFIDRSGKIVERELGLRDKSILEENIKKSLGQVSPPAKTSGQ